MRFTEGVHSAKIAFLLKHIRKNATPSVKMSHFHFSLFIFHFSLFIFHFSFFTFHFSFFTSLYFIRGIVIVPPEINAHANNITERIIPNINIL